WSFGPVAGADGNVILRNGVAQQGTQANLLYYDASGTVWQRNAHNLWWHWVNAAGQWQPNGGTLTSPIPAPPSNPPPSQSGNPPPPTAANVCGSSAPPQAAAAGFTHLDWSLDPHQPIDIGYSADGQAHTLYAGLWYEPYGSAANVVQDTANGVLKLLNYQNLSTIDKQGNGKTFNGGYFEVDGTGHDWFAFWLMSQLHAQNPNAQVASNPLTYTSELDIVEGDEGAPDDVVSTIHLDTVSPSSPVPDQQNANNVVNTGTPIEGVRHKIGALWLPDHVEIYLDGTKINSFPTYPSTNQNMMLNLSSQPGGVLNGPTVNPIEFDVNAVCVWTTK
ncbi:MAG TPA: hypothetical protein VFA22_07250, partial [Stellaceae bacterium]|nr:hypothetical protein [Stellaceae bacterium]